MKGKFDCPYCSYYAVSDIQLERHLSKFHEALLAEEGEKKRARDNKVPGTGFNPHLHNIVQGYLHGEDKGKVYDCYEEKDEGCWFYWKCVECNKELKKWFEKWTPDSKERILAEKRGEHPRYDAFKQFPAARNLMKRRV